MLMIDKLAIEHYLCMKPNGKKVKQKMRVFNTKKYIANTDEAESFVDAHSRYN